jgi:hypothetical protein
MSTRYHDRRSKTKEQEEDDFVEEEKGENEEEPDEEEEEEEKQENEENEEEEEEESETEEEEEEKEEKRTEHPDEEEEEDTEESEEEEEEEEKKPPAKEKKHSKHPKKRNHKKNTFHEFQDMINSMRKAGQTEPNKKVAAAIQSLLSNTIKKKELPLLCDCGKPCYRGEDGILHSSTTPLLKTPAFSASPRRHRHHHKHDRHHHRHHDKKDDKSKSMKSSSSMMTTATTLLASLLPPLSSTAATTMNGPMYPTASTSLLRLLPSEDKMPNATLPSSSSSAITTTTTAAITKYMPLQETWKQFNAYHEEYKRQCKLREELPTDFPAEERAQYEDAWKNFQSRFLQQCKQTAQILEKNIGFRRTMIPLDDESYRAQVEKNIQPIQDQLHQLQIIMDSMPVASS